MRDLITTINLNLYYNKGKVLENSGIDQQRIAGGFRLMGGNKFEFRQNDLKRHSLDGSISN